MAMTSIFNLDRDQLVSLCAQHDMRTYVADQVLNWVYGRSVTDPQAMSNISHADQTKLSELIDFRPAVRLANETATDGTRKLLLGWPEGTGKTTSPTELPTLHNTIDHQAECVMIPTEKRRTGCLSSQVGCPVGCSFCASGLGGLDANLTAGQIVEQVHQLAQVTDTRRITNIVFMGMGEPLANFTAVTQAIGTINAPWGFGISARKITVSTVGLPQAIRKLVQFDLPITLALSLHAPNDELRRRLIPWSKYTTIEELLEACDEYFAHTGREITLEYILLGGVNDRIEHARELADIAQRIRANINLIRYNEVKGLPFNRPNTEEVRQFQSELRRRRVNSHIRSSRGRDIAAACGQLRQEHRSPPSTAEA